MITEDNMEPIREISEKEEQPILVKKAKKPSKTLRQSHNETQPMDTDVTNGKLNGSPPKIGSPPETNEPPEKKWKKEIEMMERSQLETIILDVMEKNPVVVKDFEEALSLKSKNNVAIVEEVEQPTTQTSTESPTSEKKKKRRRKSCEISKNFACSFKGCPKAYSTKGSLSQHMKLKHSEVNGDHKTERKEARELLPEPETRLEPQ